MARQTYADNVDANGKVFKTVGDNIRMGARAGELLNFQEITDKIGSLEPEISALQADVMENERAIKKNSDDIGLLKEDKVDKPSTNDDGKIPRAKKGNVEWVEVGQPTDEQTNNAVTSWLNEHPEATTTVQNGSLTMEKFANTERLKLFDYYTPEDFGAIGDGKHDDTTAIQTMFDSAPKGAIFRFLKKNYAISDSITVKNPCTIIGEGANRYPFYENINNPGSVLSFLPGTIEKTMLTLKSAVTIQGMAFFGNSTTWSGEVTDMSIKDGNSCSWVTINYTGNNGIYCDAKGSDIINCSFFNFSGYGVFTGTMTGIHSSRFYYNNVGVVARDDGQIIDCEFGCEKYDIRDNHEEFFQDLPKSGCCNFQITHCRFDECEINHIHFGTAKHIMMVSCWGDQCGEAGLWLQTVSACYFQFCFERCGQKLRGEELDKLENQENCIKGCMIALTGYIRSCEFHVQSEQGSAKQYPVHTTDNELYHPSTIVAVYDLKNGTSGVPFESVMFISGYFDGNKKITLGNKMGYDFYLPKQIMYVPVTKSIAERRATGLNGVIVIEGVSINVRLAQQNTENLISGQISRNGWVSEFVDHTTTLAPLVGDMWKKGNTVYRYNGGENYNMNDWDKLYEL